MRDIIITFIICWTAYNICDIALTYRAEIKKLEKIQSLEDAKNWKYSG